MVVLGWVEVRHYVGVQGEVGGGWRSGPTEGAVVLVLCPSGFCDGEMDQPGFSYHLSCRLQEEEGMSSGSRVGMEDVVDLLRNKVFGGLAAVTGTLFTLVSGLLGLGYGTVRFISNYVLRLYPMRMLDTSPCFSQVQFKFRLYCPGSLDAGAMLMVTTVVGGRWEAMHSLGVIQFTGIGGTKDDHNLRVGVVLCVHAT
ncbi:uncharacterized protein [Triticum aestivum]|uniref:uncharacterized protein n=1 Tax=Triticum aestivum TaxID=4565 RepID=UPI001D00F176|nr:uncharacterized protein LOC123124235 [Triticum aestivum]